MQSKKTEKNSKDLVDGDFVQLTWEKHPNASAKYREDVLRRLEKAEAQVATMQCCGNCDFYVIDSPDDIHCSNVKSGNYRRKIRPDAKCSVWGIKEKR